METLVLADREVRRREPGEHPGGKTPYGWYLDELMARKRIPGQKVLSEIVSAEGHIISQSQVSKIMRGKPQATAAFGNALTRALQLDEEERREHAYMLVHGQDRLLSPANRESMQRYKDKVKEVEISDEAETNGDPRGESGAVDRSDRGV